MKCRAYSYIQTKAFESDEDKVVIRGMASTPTPDRSNDIVDPMGASFDTPMPLLWQHNAHKPVGNLIDAKQSKKGIAFEAEIPRIKEAGALKDRVDEAIHSLQYNLVSAVSIGYRPLDGEYEFLENGGIHFKKWEWFELSLVTIPDNPEAVLSAVKSFDRRVMSALGRDDPAVSGTQSPGDSGRRKPILLIPRRD